MVTYFGLQLQAKKETDALKIAPDTGKSRIEGPAIQARVVYVKLRGEFS